MSTDPYTLTIQVHPDGLRIVERPNWIGKAIVFPRDIFPQVRQRREFKRNGVYLLFGPHGGKEDDMLYIGEGEPILDRLDSHYANKDFWQQAVFFVAKSDEGELNKAHVQFLEARLLALAVAAKQVTLDNIRAETEPTLSEFDRINIEMFLKNILSITPALNINAFTPAATLPSSVGAIELFCRRGAVEARGHKTTQGFVVKKDSQAVAEDSPSLLKFDPMYPRKKQELLDDGVLAKKGDCLVFCQDYTFTSPTGAASCVRGLGSSLADWTDKNGRTLREIQEEELKKVK